MPEEKGTGKHPHKSSEDPRPHSEKSGHGGTQTMEDEQSGESRLQDTSEADDLKKREYRDEKGEIHHHTRTYEEQHKGEREKEKSSR